MPGHEFGEGDLCRLDLALENAGAARLADLYVLLDVFGTYYAYPSWAEIGGGLDYRTLPISAGEHSTISLIAEFTIPAAPPCGPLHFYAALFDCGCLDLDHLVSNIDSWQFALR